MEATIPSSFELSSRYLDFSLSHRKTAPDSRALAIYHIAPCSLLSWVSYSASPIFSINVTSAGSHYAYCFHIALSSCVLFCRFCCKLLCRYRSRSSLTGWCIFISNLVISHSLPLLSRFLAAHTSTISNSPI